MFFCLKVISYCNDIMFAYDIIWVLSYMDNISLFMSQQFRTNDLISNVIT